MRSILKPQYRNVNGFENEGEIDEYGEPVDTKEDMDSADFSKSSADFQNR